LAVEAFIIFIATRELVAVVTKNYYNGAKLADQQQQQQQSSFCLVGRVELLVVSYRIHSPTGFSTAQQQCKHSHGGPRISFSSSSSSFSFRRRRCKEEFPQQQQQQQQRL